jgi:hypothetical protein
MAAAPPIRPRSRNPLNSGISAWSGDAKIFDFHGARLRWTIQLSRVNMLSLAAHLRGIARRESGMPRWGHLDNCRDSSSGWIADSMNVDVNIASISQFIKQRTCVP